MKFDYVIYHCGESQPKETTASKPEMPLHYSISKL